MDLFTRDDLQALLQERHTHCLSIYLSTHRRGSEADPIRWRKRVHDAEEQLVAAGVRPTDARHLLKPARELLEDGTFWKNQSDGLAFFLSDDFVKFYRVPLVFTELSLVGKHFHVLPLLPLISGDGRFFVLAISQNAVRLLQGTRFGVSEVNLKGVPKNIAEALLSHDTDETLTFHSRPSEGSGPWSAIFHGKGVGIDDKKDDILRYFQKIDHGMHALLKQERAPLVLAGVDYLLPIYRKSNTYPHLLQKGIEGNPDRLRDQELHDKAWPLVQPCFQQAQNKALAQYEQLAGTGRTSCTLGEVVPAAFEGQLETLMVARERNRWGRFDPATKDVEEHEQAEPGDEDLFNLAIIYNLRRGRSVHVLDFERMPRGTEIMAVYCLPLAKHGHR